MTTKNIAGTIGRGIIACSLACTLGLGLVACDSGTSGTDTSSSTTATQSADQIAAPSDLNIDFSTGTFTFTSNDEDAGYYFLRVYENNDGEQASEYSATSERVSGGKTGTLEGTIDLSGLSWKTYNFNLVGAASTSSSKEAPETQVFTYKLGVGGVMERPEMMVLSDGNTAEFYIDLYTLSDWYKTQRMPTVEFNIYSDAECTQLVKTETADLSDMSPVEASGPWVSGTMWATDPNATHLYLQPAADSGQQAGPMASPTEPTGLVSQLVVDDLDAGTYYVTATAKGTDDGTISDSKPSDAVEFTVTADAPTGEFTATKTSMWVDPELSAMGASAQEGTQPDRVDTAASQTTTGELVS
jgi:hypothetical protein